MTKITKSITKKRRPKSKLDETFINTIIQDFLDNKSIRKKIPGGGRVHIDRQLPFFIIYRFPTQDKDKGTPSLLYGEASHLILPDDSPDSHAINLIKALSEAAASVFGSSLVLEVWAKSPEQASGSTSTFDSKRLFRIWHGEDWRDGSELSQFKRLLYRMKSLGGEIIVETQENKKFHPPGLKPLSALSRKKKTPVFHLGLEIFPYYQDPKTKEVFPLELNHLRRQLGLALKQFFFNFTRTKTSHFPRHYHALGQKAMAKNVWLVDRSLDEISTSFDFLLCVTPINTEKAWSEFKGKGCERRPHFLYRPLPLDPLFLKRKLHNIALEEIEDPAIAMIFREKHDELDRKLSLLLDRNKKEFLFGSLQLFKGVSDEVFATATEILNSFKTPSPKSAKGAYLTAQQIAQAAEQEIKYYRDLYPAFSAKVKIREDISGLIVAGSDFLIGKHSTINKNRLQAVLAHEVGTHLLTYFNGLAQPFKQISSGLAGYDELQEGIAVLSEYLVGELTESRLRLLAARVMAVDKLIKGANFIEVYRELTREWGFADRLSFEITTRVFRGGGLTKDVVYLSGLLKVLDYLKKKGEVETLFIGKINNSHIPLIKELQWREVFRPVPLLPRYLAEPNAISKLEKLKLAPAPIKILIGEVK